MVCCLDRTTGLVQLQNVTSAAERYDLVDYSYTSSNSQVSQQHWIEFFNSVTTKVNLRGSYILEIGSNDGFLLSQFKQITSHVIGIDASSKMTSEANSRGIRTVHGIFGESAELNSTFSGAEKNTMQFLQITF